VYSCIFVYSLSLSLFLHFSLSLSLSLSLLPFSLTLSLKFFHFFVYGLGAMGANLEICELKYTANSLETGSELPSNVYYVI